MSKRRPGTELTHDNWDEEEESEEAGTFTQAKKTVLEKREIKKAKRKAGALDQSNGDAESAPAAFKGFTGFAPTSAATTPQFSFKLQGNSQSTPTQNTASMRHEGMGGPMCSTTGGGSSTSSISSVKQGFAGNQNSKYLHQLKSLNQSVTKWISDHVDKNPYCILSPIFGDYEKHLVELEKRYPNHSNDGDSEQDSSDKNGEKKQDETKAEESKTVTEEEKPKPPIASPPPSFTFGAAGSAAGPATSDTKPAAGGGMFGSFGGGAKMDSSATPGSSIFGGFGTAGKTDGASSSGFSFAAKPSSGASTSATTGDGEDEYVPPKNEVEAVKEDDAYYTKRCKLYYKKGDTWADRGVGNLYLKKSDDETVLLVRADTALGNILLNILVAGSMPVNRQGKNNVMLSCIPNPPIDEKKKDDKTPVSMLIRVKNAEDADELFDKIKEAKGAESS